MQEPTFPALTLAEQGLVERYLRVVDVLARMNPAREPGRLPTTYWRQPAQALLAASRDLLASVEEMIERGEDEIHAPTLTRAMVLLDADTRTGRLRIPPQEPAPPDG